MEVDETSLILNPTEEDTGGEGREEGEEEEIIIEEKSSREETDSRNDSERDEKEMKIPKKGAQIKVYESKDVNIDQMIKEEYERLPQHVRMRKKRINYMLSHQPSLLYASFATGQSLEVIKLKLKRLLNPLAEDSSEAERRDFEIIMSYSLSAGRNT